MVPHAGDRRLVAPPNWSPPPKPSCIAPAGTGSQELHIPHIRAAVRPPDGCMAGPPLASSNTRTACLQKGGKEATSGAAVTIARRPAGPLSRGRRVRVRREVLPGKRPRSLSGSPARRPRPCPSTAVKRQPVCPPPGRTAPPHRRPADERPARRRPAPPDTAAWLRTPQHRNRHPPRALAPPLVFIDPNDPALHCRPSRPPGLPRARRRAGNGRSPALVRIFATIGGP